MEVCQRGVLAPAAPDGGSGGAAGGGEPEKFATVDHSIFPSGALIPLQGDDIRAIPHNGTGHISLAIELELDGGSPGGPEPRF